jgi:large subunit ribosomal protein L17
MVTSFLKHERITTTDAKAKELRPIAEKMITLGKQGDLNAIRLAASFIRDKKVVTKLFSVIGPRYKEREGGYTRIIKLGTRLGDAAQLSIIELVEEQLQKKESKKSAKPSVKAEPVQKAPKEAEEAATPAAEAPTAPEAAE